MPLRLSEDCARHAGRRLSPSMRLHR
jgi:hypothetical protein